MLKVGVTAGAMETLRVPKTLKASSELILEVNYSTLTLIAPTPA
jgi:hypothetical protein